MPTADRRKAAASKKGKGKGADVKAKTLEAGDDQEPLSAHRKPGSPSNPDAPPQNPDLETTNEDPQPGGKTQLRLAGQERIRDKKVEKLALRLHATQTERLTLQSREKAERAELEAEMKNKGITRQLVPGGLVAEIDPGKEKAKVHQREPDEMDED